MEKNLQKVKEVLNLHYETFFKAALYADETLHPTPCDSRAWSQIIVSLLCGIKGIKRKKGADLEDGSDVKAANTWGAIDTPRFNGVIKAGTKSARSGNMTSLDQMPKLFFVLWDNEPINNLERCRVWCVRPDKDQIFRQMCSLWYRKRERGEIVSSNFQLHPPRGKNSNEFRNTCGNLLYPLVFSAEWKLGQYEVTFCDLSILDRGCCKKKLKN